MIEQEYKQLLTAAEYATLLTAFPWEAAVPQVNHYYTDAAGALKRDNITVRIRERMGQFQLQVKSPVREDGALSVKSEHERPIDSAPASLPSAFLRGLTDIAVSDITHIGTLTTWRRIYRPHDGVELCLDESHYFSSADYELELEYTGTAPPLKLMESLAAHGIKFDAKTDGKYARFIDALNTQTER